MWNIKPDYRGIVLQLSEAHNADDLAKAMANEEASKDSEFGVPEAESCGRVHRYRYLSGRRFTASQRILDEITVKRHGKTQYEYDFYLCEIPVERGCGMALVCPFLEMLEHLVRQTKKGIAGTSFLTIRIDPLIQMLIDGNTMDGRLSISLLQLQLLESVKSICLTGPDVINSKTFRLLRKSHLSAMGARARRCRINLALFRPRRKLGVLTDLFGNISVRLSREGANLGMIGELWNYLSTQEVVVPSSVSPLEGKVAGELEHVRQ